LSTLAINKILYRREIDPSFKEYFSSHADDVMREYHLSEEEKAALRNLDIRQLFIWGVHPLLVFQYSVIDFHMNRDDYRQKLQGISVD
jgi:hypothetical protein